MNTIGLKNYKREFLFLKNKVTPVMIDIIKNGRFILYKDLADFEENFAKFTGSKRAVGVASGTEALHLALLAVGIKKGDEVITAPMSFNATAEAITMCGAIPVFVDVIPENLSIDTSKIEKAITKKTKAILPVHIYGIPAEMNKIVSLCKKYQLFLIEDCAQAHGAYYQGRHVGTIGDIGCFSFYPGKNLSCYGDGGGIITNNDIYADKIKRLRNHGSIAKYIHGEDGFAERLDNLQAAILNVKLKFLKIWNKRRNEVARLYSKGLDLSKVRIVRVPKDCISSHYAYVIFVKGRTKLMEKLNQKNIITDVIYPLPLHLQPVYKRLGYKKGNLPVVESAAEGILALPINPFIKDEEVKYVIDQINKYA